MAFFATLGLSSLLVAASGPRDVAEVSDAMGPPTVGGRPVVVAIGFYVMDFARITPRDESFDATGYLELSWRDPRLALGPAASPKPGARRRVDTSRVWTPRTFFENVLEQPKYHGEPVVEADDEGAVTSWVIVSGKFSSEMDLRRFPFDRQALTVRIGAFEDASDLGFSPRRELVLVGEDAFVSDWTLGTPSASVGSRPYVPNGESYARFEYRVGVVRRSTFYVWRVLVPLTLLAAVSWAAFWFEPVGLQPQISTCMACLIALVAFNFAIDFSLPKVAYLTLIDRHALIGFAFVAAAVVVVTSVHVAVTSDRLRVARTIQRAARRTFPPAYALAVALNLSLPPSG